MTMPRNPQTKMISWRLAAEFFSTIFFLSGLVALPIAEATAIGQFTPIAITAAAAVFMREPIGWRRWLAAVFGLIGVMLIIRPGTAAFSPAAILILVAVAFVVRARFNDARNFPRRADIDADRYVGIDQHSVRSSDVAVRDLDCPGRHATHSVDARGVLFDIAYALTVIAMRSGEVGVVSPFRYAIIVFAILSGWLVWGRVAGQNRRCSASPS